MFHPLGLSPSQADFCQARRFRLLLVLALGCMVWPAESSALGQPQYVDDTPTPGSFALAQGGQAASVEADPADWPGVTRAAEDLRADLTRVTGLTPGRTRTAHTLIVGTIGRSPVIDGLIRAGKIDAGAITGRWESFLLQTVANPLPGVDQALVIAGSDKRGTIYGIYDLSEEMGVSPWYWWSDVPTRHRDALFVRAGRQEQGEPGVKYRGIFLNDELPDLSDWVRNKYGNAPGFPAAANYGHEFYARLFEVILRMKGNYLWPAMWHNAFNEDDTENPRLADLYGIVMGTSHQEPMLRAQGEWDRLPVAQRGGNWNWANVAQRPVLTQFWRDGVRRNKDYENIYTVGLRAENDSGAETGLAATEEIVGLQRKILAEEVNPDVTKVPQLWCLYKEVMSYYAQGLHPPDDITLLWAEDNWGNVRRLPTAAERTRAGGAGIYYHLDYHGGPRNYQWLNSTPIAHVWDQMALAKQYGADRIWIVNVGHFKGQEFPMEYFLSLGWNPARWTSENLGEYTRLWAAREFGPGQAGEIADLVAKYTKYNGRRKPELLEPGTYSQTSYHEAETVIDNFAALITRAEAVSARLPADARYAFYQLVLFPIKAAAQVNEMYVAAGRNALFVKQGRASANDEAAHTQAMFQADRQLMADYNNTFAGGKWQGFMDQKHIGYTMWNEPLRETAPRVTTVTVPAEASMGVAVEGSDAAWPGAAGEAVLPAFDSLNQPSHYIDVFDKGQAPLAFAVTTSDPWIIIPSGGTTPKDLRLPVGIDWNRAPKGAASGTVAITGAGGTVSVRVNILNLPGITRDTLEGFAEGEGGVAIEPEHFTRNTAAGAARWDRIEDYGRTLSGMRADAPVDVAGLTPGPGAPCLEYQMYLTTVGPATATLMLSPALNIAPDRAVRIAVAFDQEAPQVVTIVPQGYNVANGNADWEESVRDSARLASTAHTITTAGYHTLKVWMVDPAVVIQKIVVDLGGVKPSYLGPPESYHHSAPPPPP